MNSVRPCDFFISYTHVDRPWAEWIAWQLQELGYTTLIQAWDFLPGSNWIRGMQHGLTRARKMIAVLSPAYLRSEYGEAEWLAIWAKDPSGEKRMLLTVMVATCDRPGLLSGVTGTKLVGLDEVHARARIEKVVLRALSPTGRVEPSAPPRFPGATARTTFDDQRRGNEKTTSGPCTTPESPRTVGIDEEYEADSERVEPALATRAIIRAILTVVAVFVVIAILFLSFPRT